MKYREVGNTGMRISEIGFGTGDNAGLMVKGTFEQQVEAVESALDLGINYFDTSPDYGKGIAETNIGKLMREIGFRPYLTTKVEVMPDELDLPGLAPVLFGRLLNPFDCIARLASRLAGRKVRP